MNNHREISPDKGAIFERTRSGNAMPNDSSKSGNFVMGKHTDHFRTKHGLLNRIYLSQKHKSFRRNYPPPTYTFKQFESWAMGQNKFHTLHDAWVNSGYNIKLVPSVDRTDDYKSYTFDNIQLMTWGENHMKECISRKSGVNNKQSKAVIMIDDESNEIKEYYSLRQASRETGEHPGSISKSCHAGRRVGKYEWKFKI